MTFYMDNSSFHAGQFSQFSFTLVALFVRKTGCSVRYLDATIKAAIRVWNRVEEYTLSIPPSYQTAAIIEEVAEQYSPGAVHSESDDTQQLSRLCPAHFTADAFEEDLYARYVGRSPGKATRRRLKADAFPTEFAFTATVDGSATEQRQVRERRRAQASIDVYRQTTKARP